MLRSSDFSERTGAIAHDVRRQGFAARGVMLTLGAVFLAAAAGKTWDFTFTSVAIQYVLGSSMSFAIVLAVLLAILESALGWSLLLDVGRRVALWISLVALIVFSFVLVRLWLDPSAPSCGCFGAVRNAILGGDRSPLGLVRNGLMTWGLLWLLRVEYRRRR